jgi:hypothetical protein
MVNVDERIKDVDELSLPFALDSEGALFVDPARLCQMVGINPDKLKLQLLMWRTFAEYLGRTSSDESQINYLPASMIPDFLETLKMQPIHSSRLGELTFFQQMFLHINKLTGQSSVMEPSLWATETMTRLRRFVLSQLVADRRERERRELETECLLD